MANDETITTVSSTSYPPQNASISANTAGTTAANAPEEKPAKPEPEKDKATPEKKYTDSDVDEIIKKRLARAHAEWESKAAKEREEATEAEKLKGMNELDRAKHERERLEKENAALIEQINLSQQMEVARETLAESGINFPPALLKMFVSPDATKTKEAVDAVTGLWAAEVDRAVKDALRAQPPKSPNPTAAATPSAGKTFAEAYNAKMNGGN